MEEIWKDIKGYEGLYQVSNFGKVKSIKLKNEHILSDKRITKGRGNIEGYVKYSLSKNSVAKNYFAHKLVAVAFLENKENKLYVDHIDGNSLNNNVKNLRWCSASENNNNPITKKRRRIIFENKRKKIEEIKKEKNKIKEITTKKQRIANYAKYWYKGKTLSSYCKENGLNIYTIRDRIRNLGMSIEDSIKYPILTQREKVLLRFGKYEWKK
jgi:hypothetical protein